MCSVTFALVIKYDALLQTKLTNSTQKSLSPSLFLYNTSAPVHV